MRSRYIVILVIVVLSLGATAIFLNSDKSQNRVEQSEKVSLINTNALNNLPTKDVSNIDTSHLAEGLVPPTNKWFSGIALQQEPKAIFPTPLKFDTTENSFSYSLPTAKLSTNSIIASTNEAVTVAIAGATAYKITRYDELSVDLTYFNGERKLATVVLVAGSPYIQLTAHDDLTVDISSPAQEINIDGTRLSISSEAAKYYAVGSDAVSLSGQESNSIQARIPKNGLVSFLATPTGQKADVLLKYATNRITGTTVNYRQAGDMYITDIKVDTENNRPTVLGYLPHHNYDKPAVITYNTIYGPQKMVEGTTFSSTSELVDVEAGLNVNNLTAEEKALLVTALRRDINATKHLAVDSYFSGKELYRSAQLLQLARQLDEKAIAGTIQTKLNRELSTWLTTSSDKTKKFFYYDPKLRSIVGEMPSFGSQEANDHHFHYGYFIYAAAILAEYDADFAKNYKDQVNLLIADISNYSPDQPLPQRRVFDPYFGHSWASGVSPFDDGNNQESISEALNAWTATALWARQTGNASLESQAGWMLSVESEAAASYWLDMDTSEAPYTGEYAHSFVSLNWGGKRDNATFFSAEPNAKLGILLIPMNPTMAKVLPDADRVNQHLKEVIKDTYDIQFGDYLLMYRALHTDSPDTLQKAQSLSDSTVDGANSRSYMYAWIMSK